jgi:hypothetical protein
MKIELTKIVFRASAVYDGMLALSFLVTGSIIYDFFEIEKPNHMGYLHFPALLLLVFAIMLWRIASNPVKFRDLIPYGVGLKASYCLVVLYHSLSGGIPFLWIPFAWIDFGFLILFVLAWKGVRNANGI